MQIIDFTFKSLDHVGPMFWHHAREAQRARILFFGPSDVLTGSQVRVSYKKVLVFSMN